MRDDTIVYLKPSNNAPQKHFEALEKEDDLLAQQIKRVWRRAKHRKTGQSQFLLELFVYMKREDPPTTIRRATQSRIQEQLPRVEAFLQENCVSSGPASSLYMATSQARLPPETPMEVPNNATFRQLQFIDEQQRAIDERVSAAIENDRENYPTVRIMLHNIEVPVRVNIHDLRSVLGLPNFSLRPPFRGQASTFGLPISPSADIDDEEHKEDQDGFLFES
ncbi:hypothetical protein PHMEG_00012061 [Phytophthora megakarya]|uniref:Uncharacterized protein n=1 Tax=Phytophthora megakarya TaxID=4795 RepID=A0A225WA23_9STRA|nr:hypothetical protein PHMEG_00012061 [Phytophthora megakarya]